MASSNRPYSVAIVGFGPTGATLANLLGQAGIATVIIDREQSIYHLPRAVHFDDEVMRVFQTIGLADAIAKKLRVNVGMRFVDKAGKLLLDWPRPQEISHHGWHASYRFHQPDLETILRAGLDRFDCVDILTETDVTEVSQTENQVTLTCHQGPDAAPLQLTADYVIGCDGARSLIRQVAGLAMDDFGFNERWLVLDILLKQDKPSLGDFSIQYCDPDFPATYVRGPENRRRWEIRLPDDVSNEQAVLPDHVWGLLKAWLTPDEADIERAAVYTFDSKVVQTWRYKRLLVAGDAAHLTPPFMGQGMCAGIRDISNLGWKLIAVTKGRAQDGLLDSYGTERYNNAAEYVKTAVRLGGLINMAGTEEALRAALKPPDRKSAAKMESIAPPLGPGLGAGDADYRGTLFGQPRLLDGRLSDEVFGYQAVLYLDETGFSAQALQQVKASKIPTLSVTESSNLADFLSRREVKAILARGDRYVVGSANSDESLLALCDWDKGFSLESA